MDNILCRDTSQTEVVDVVRFIVSQILYAAQVQSCIVPHSAAFMSLFQFRLAR